ncbi:transcription antitermination protein NusB [Microlunatus phosphovorus NM-1]|uniref:Transcription antitermination protein NusB n=1 Tax=Microlunatus phosphovorus (strain ATCC 700054 / DSM 10555 / JCM 9379 / NBRC 101784 / NCIMB 13414 / VKM Ac-1990 / NM-1) TaxID=1032480 RepID=F5XH23_MICPN|nr:transcription antitermination factor NusB [Microlunatus phosphovorus]BAK35655.1 transcription antitermination protein NusB [Microlunatus phosphovorus NM-1]
MTARTTPPGGAAGKVKNGGTAGKVKNGGAAGKMKNGGAAGGVRNSSTQTKARKRALDVLFEAELRETDPLVTLAERAADAEPPVRDYTRELVRGVNSHQDTIDGRIAEALAAGWSLARLPRVDRNLMRIAVYEIDHTTVPDAVAVSEAVGLVAQLSTDDSPAFLNGVLGTVVATKSSS